MISERGVIIDGFLFVDKPKKMTSLDVCNKIKRTLSLDKCGHSGTLDPNTTGILVVACNKATKLLKLINEHDKEYIATISFGYDSDTLDFDGMITKDVEMVFTQEELEHQLEALSKLEVQIPPMTSSIKIQGKKLYEYQRKGIEIKVEPRKTKIYSYEILSPLRTVEGHLEFDIKLSVVKGFYVRSFARDLGSMLNGCAILKELRRTKVGEFNVDSSIPLNEIQPSDMISIQKMFPFPSIEVNDYMANLVKNGVMLDERQTTLNEPFYVKNNCDIIAIYEVVEPLKYKPILIFK